MRLSSYRTLLEDVRGLATQAEQRPTPERIRALRGKAARLQAADCPDKESIDVQIAEVVLEHARGILRRADCDPTYETRAVEAK